jgi:hypothetical protein
MSLNQETSQNPAEPCTWQPTSACVGCQLGAELMCRYDPRDLTSFFVNFLPFGIAVIAGMILGGYGIFLLGWFAYWIFFFFVWEARVLCSHCPFWAEEGRILHCHANCGVFKIWPYRPGPMSRSEQIQFILGASIFVLFPLVFMVLGGQYLLVVLAVASAISAGYNLRKNTCSRCIQFSCPVNIVPKATMDAYLRRNPGMRSAWEASGYRLGE